MNDDELASERRPANSDRKVDWLELFFDLVFVVAVKQLADMLHGEPVPLDFVAVAGLLALTWAVWLNVTLFTNVVGEKQRGRRIAVLVAMAAVALIALGIPDAISEGAVLIVAGYTLARVAMWPLWVKLQRSRGQSGLRATITGPGLAMLWVVSLALPEQWRAWAWLALISAEVGISIVGFQRTRFSAPHMVERVGLFTMIVLGESVVELILAVDPRQSPVAWAVSAAGFTLICAFWWVYFEGSERTGQILTSQRSSVLRDVVVPGHYLIVLGLIGVAAGLGAAIEHADDGHLPYPALVALCGGVAIYHLAYIFMGARYGLASVRLALLTPLAVVVPAMVLILGRDWPPLLVVLLLVADVTVRGIAVPALWRRVPGSSTPQIAPRRGG